MIRYGRFSAGNTVSIEKNRKDIATDTGIFNYAYDPLNRLKLLAHSGLILLYFFIPLTVVPITQKC